MRNGYGVTREEQIEIARTLVQSDARLCINCFGMAWKGIFRYHAQEELAVFTGMSIRAAAYELSGEREPSPKSLAVLMGLCAGTILLERRG